MEHLVQRGDYFSVYGSLMRGMSGALPGAFGDAMNEALTYCGECRLFGRLYDLGHYPGLVAVEAQATPRPTVAAEFYRVDDPAIFRVLDDYEDFRPEAPEHSLYLRRKVQAAAPAIPVWAYYYVGPFDQKRLIESGSWRERLGLSGGAPDYE